MTTRVYRWSKRLLLPLAALPVFQATGTCDLSTIVGSALSQFGSATFSSLVTSTTSVLLQNYPTSEMLQIILGGNPFPFFRTA
jgi:hypothetical protein